MITDFLSSVFVLLNLCVSALRKGILIPVTAFFVIILLLCGKVVGVFIYSNNVICYQFMKNLDIFTKKSGSTLQL